MDPPQPFCTSALAQALAAHPLVRRDYHEIPNHAGLQDLITSVALVSSEGLPFATFGALLSVLSAQHVELSGPRMLLGPQGFEKSPALGPLLIPAVVSLARPEV